MLDELQPSMKIPDRNNGKKAEKYQAEISEGMFA